MLVNAAYFLCSFALFAISSKESLDRLEEGNVSYLAGDFYQLDHEQESELRAQNKAGGQRPIAALLTCSDSRIPVERIFNVALGEIFVVKTAGNIIERSQVASLEYAVRYLRVPLVVVLGHTHCGMADMALSCSETKGALGELMRTLRPMVDDIKAKHAENRDYILIRKLVDLAWQDLEKSPIISKAIQMGEVKIVRAMYDIEIGQVRFLDEIHQS